jgi:hypothetical protein
MVVKYDTVYHSLPIHAVDDVSAAEKMGKSKTLKLPLQAFQKE